MPSFINACFISPLTATLLLVLASEHAQASLGITEFSANSSESFPDGDDDFPDWIELHNTGNINIRTTGYALTDNPDLPRKWPIPDAIIPAGEYLVVFASGKDRITPGEEFHSNFSLGDEGEYLALTGPDGDEPVDEFNYPKQFYAISYGKEGYFSMPTPGTANAPLSYTDYVRDTKFSSTRGLFEVPFTLEISSNTSAAKIFYTTDFTLPAPDNGTLYTQPLFIATTTVIRAIATAPGMVSSNVDTQTYIFPGDVINQPESPEGFPSTWGIDNSTHNGNTGLPRPADYEMDPDIIAQFGAQTVIEALQHHPSISLIMKPDDLFSESRNSLIGGIYSNPYGGTGNQFMQGWGTPEQWERPGSVEFIGFNGIDGKQVDCGVRIAGNYARHPNRYKHHLRITFRRKYGPAKLQARLFSRTSVDTFDDLILRGGNSESWTFPGNTGNGPGTRGNVQYMRDQFYKDSQVAMGHLSANQEYFHLYINGLYWGFYTLIERVDAHFLSQHLGGNEDDYDVFKQNNVLSDGMRDDWETMYAISRSGLSGTANYNAIQNYLDVDNLIDYVLFNFYAGNVDWRNNWRAGRRRATGEGFRFFMWDGERGLGDQSGNSTYTFDSTGRNWNYHATELHQDLAANADYRLRFADHIERALFNDGPLTAKNSKARYNARADEIRPSLIAESARWGDRQRPNNPYTIENEWKAELQWLNEVFFPLRTDIVMNQFRAKNLYPEIPAPIFSLYGGHVEKGFPLRITSESSSIYFTTDGSDPRLSGGAVNPTAQIISGGGGEETMLIPAGTSWRYDDSGNDLGEIWRDPAFDDILWSKGSAPLGFGLINGTTLETIINPSRNLTVYFRQSFELNEAAALTAAHCKAQIDGGAIVYINGIEIIRDNMPAGPINYFTRSSSDGNEGDFDNFSFSPQLLAEGTNTIAAELHNISAGSSDMVFDLSLSVIKPSGSAMIIDNPVTVRARSHENGNWSAVTEATFTTAAAAGPESLVISEIHYNPAGTSEEAEFIELLNISGAPISLAGVRFSAGIHYAFTAQQMLAPGEHLALTPSQYSGQLDNGGETITILAGDDSIIRDFRYDDRKPWPVSTDGTGYSLVLANPAANPDHNLAQSWLPGNVQGGSPGTDDRICFDATPGIDVVDFFLGNSPITTRIENGNVIVGIPRMLAAKGADLSIEISTDLESWDANKATFQGYSGHAENTATMLWSLPQSRKTVFARVRITANSR
ncbi:MAG: lamin tail domain-containing protein [Verrucomicrobiales bacterium]